MSEDVKKQVVNEIKVFQCFRFKLMSQLTLAYVLSCLYL